MVDGRVTPGARTPLGQPLLTHLDKEVTANHMHIFHENQTKCIANLTSPPAPKLLTATPPAPDVMGSMQMECQQKDPALTDWQGKYLTFENFTKAYGYTLLSEPLPGPQGDLCK